MAFDKEAFKNNFSQARPGFRQNLRDQGWSGQELRDRMQGFRRAARTSARTADRQQSRPQGVNFDKAMDRGQNRTTQRGQQIAPWGIGADSTQDQRGAVFNSDFRSVLMDMLRRMFGGG